MIFYTSGRGKGQGTTYATGSHVVQMAAIRRSGPREEGRPIGVWAQRCRPYLKQHDKILCCNLLTACKFHSSLADVEEEAQLFFLRLVKEYAETVCADLIFALFVFPSSAFLPRVCPFTQHDLQFSSIIDIIYFANSRIKAIV